MTKKLALGIVLGFLGCFQTVWPQEKSPNPLLTPEMEILIDHYKSQYSLYAVQKATGGKGSLFSGEDVMAFYDEPAAPVKHKDRVIQIIRGMDLISEKRALYFWKVPVSFIKSGVDTFVLLSMAVDSIYNNQETTPEGRLADVLRSVVLPGLRPFSEGFSVDEMGYFAMVIAYGIRNSPDKGNEGVNVQAELAGIIVSARDGAAFVDGEISANELLGKSRIYLCDSHNPSGFKKVDVRID